MEIYSQKLRLISARESKASMRHYLPCLTTISWWKREWWWAAEEAQGNLSSRIIRSNRKNLPVFAAIVRLCIHGWWDIACIRCGERAREPSSKSKQWIFNSSSSPLSSSSSRICHTLIGADVYRAQHKGIINFHFQLRFMDETSLSLSRLSCRDSVSTPATEKKWKKKHNCNSKQQHITLESLRNGTQKIVRSPYEKNIYILQICIELCSSSFAIRCALATSEVLLWL